ncbi:MAG: hypothetical protein BWY09_02677 [Candidatus Hydrogenedentes bacterium ADurb.Bin179]|nr:MAG: hypothetical protein BWY09_02677 [Candidatus Hydrogenedentes bacterium ADurb.Bin179]
MQYVIGIVLLIGVLIVAIGSCGFGSGEGDGDRSDPKQAIERIEEEKPIVADNSVLVKVAGEKYLINNETLDFERVLEKLDAIKESESIKEIRIDSKDARMNQYNELIQACKERGIGYKEI